MSKQKYYLFQIEEHNGEQEYIQEHLAALSSRQKPEVYAKRLIKNWYEDDFTGWLSEGVAEFGFGERIAELFKYQEIPKEHYDILKLYI